MFQIFADFDGTITDKDSIVFLTEKFGGGPDYRNDILRQFQRGEITAFETIEKELASVRVCWSKAASALLEHISIDSAFPDFVRWCKQHNYPLSVVSSGIKRVLSLFIGNLNVPVFAHPVEIDETGWQYRRSETNDKTNIVRAAKAHSTHSNGQLVYVGDGISDIAVIPYVDILFAKSYLARYCRENSISFLPFESFYEVRERLEKLAQTS